MSSCIDGCADFVIEQITETVDVYCRVVNTSKLLEYCSIIARNILPRHLVEQFPIKNPSNAKLDPVQIVEAWSIQALKMHDIVNKTETQHYNNSIVDLA